MMDGRTDRFIFTTNEENFVRDGGRGRESIVYILSI